MTDRTQGQKDFTAARDMNAKQSLRAIYMADAAFGRAEEVATDRLILANDVADLEARVSQIEEFVSLTYHPMPVDTVRHEDVVSGDNTPDPMVNGRRIEVHDCSGWSCYGCRATNVNTQIWVGEGIVYLCQECVDTLRQALNARAASAPDPTKEGVR